MKIQKKKIAGWGSGGRVGGGCEWRSEAFVKIQKKKFFFFGGGGGRVRGSDWGGGVCQGGWVEICENFQKNNFFFSGEGSGWGGGGRQVGGSGWM